jgi:hypothetical protein
MFPEPEREPLGAAFQCSNFIYVLCPLAPENSNIASMD